MAQRQSDEYGNPTHNTALGSGDQQQQKQGIVEKIKERIPGVSGNKQDDQCLGQGQGQAGRPTAATQGLGGTAKPDGCDAASPQEKKGMMEKIKEKLPGGHK